MDGEGNQNIHGRIVETCGKCLSENKDLVQSMLVYLAQTNAYFSDTQRDVDEPSFHEKQMIAHEILHKNPSTFITRYGSFLNDAHKAYFYNISKDNRDVVYQLNLLEQEQSRAVQTIKNRRFSAMKELMRDGEYFSDEQMKYRDPLLYEQMIGQYLTEDEITEQSNQLLRGHCGLSSVLLEHMDSTGTNQLYQSQRDRQEEQLEESDDDEDEEEAAEEEEMVEGATSITNEEKQALREEFLHVMQERFLSGADHEFNYSEVDNNSAYDDLVQEGLDAEEKYFDSEEETVVEEPSQLAPDEYDY